MRAERAGSGDNALCAVARSGRERQPGRKRRHCGGRREGELRRARRVERQRLSEPLHVAAAIRVGRIIVVLNEPSAGRRVSVTDRGKHRRVELRLLLQHPRVVVQGVPTNKTQNVPSVKYTNVPVLNMSSN